MVARDQQREAVNEQRLKADGAVPEVALRADQPHIHLRVVQNLAHVQLRIIQIGRFELRVKADLPLHLPLQHQHGLDDAVDHMRPHGHMPVEENTQRPFFDLRAAFHAPQPLAEMIVFHQQARGRLLHLDAGRRERDGAALAVEQRHAVVFLQLPYLLAERGLGNVQIFRRPAEAERAGDRQKIPYPPKIHRFRPPIRRFLLL